MDIQTCIEQDEQVPWLGYTASIVEGGIECRVNVEWFWQGKSTSLGGKSRGQHLQPWWFLWHWYVYGGWWRQWIFTVQLHSATQHSNCLVPVIIVKILFGVFAIGITFLKV